MLKQISKPSTGPKFIDITSKIELKIINFQILNVSSLNPKKLTILGKNAEVSLTIMETGFRPVTDNLGKTSRILVAKVVHV